MAENVEVRKKKLQYATTPEIWGKVLQVQGGEMLYSRTDTLDFLINLGFETWKEQNEKEQ